jgi:hypothetical protein
MSEALANLLQERYFRRPTMQQGYTIQHHRRVQGSGFMGYVRQKQRVSVLAFMGGEQEILQRTSRA